MNADTISTAPASPGPWRSGPALIGGAAFIGGVALTIGALALFNGLAPQPVAAPVAAQTAAAPAAPAALPPGTDLVTLAAREQALAGKLDQIELRIRDSDGSARNASLYATRAERMMIAAAARRALDRRESLGAIEGQLRGRFGESNPEAVAAIVNAAREPVTLEDLRLALDTVAPRLVGGGGGIWSGAQRLLGDLIVLRRADEPSTRAVDRLRRARHLLERGDVERALGEVAYMPGVGEAEQWVVAARRYVAGRRGLSAIEAASLQVPAAAPPVVPAPPAPAAS